MGSTVNHQPYNGDKSIVRVAIGKIKPVFQTLTLDNAAQKGATSITVTTALAAPIDKDNWLLFTDADGLEYLAKVTADAAVDATTLTVRALDVEIPDTSTSPFPSELYDRSSIDLDFKYSAKDIFTLNTGGDRQVVTTSSQKSAKAPGFWYFFNAGLHICREASESKKPIWLFVEYEPPSPDYSKGVTNIGKAVISSRPKQSPADGFITQDLDFEFTGPVEEIQPVPKPAAPSTP